MRDVVIAGYLRTAQSRARPREPERDVFGQLRTDEMLAWLLPALLERSRIEPGEVDDFILGCAQPFGEQFTIGGRTPLLLANLDWRTPTKVVDQQCGSAITAAQTAFLEIATGNADIVVCAGMEHMTRLPMNGYGALEQNPRLASDPGLAHWDIRTANNMGLTAEKLAEAGGITREAMDAWGVRSHRRARQAQEDGFLAGEILPIDAPQADGSTLAVDEDQSIRGDANMESMAGLRTPFKEAGRITPGNASPLNAGASALALMSRDTARDKQLAPLAFIRSIGFAGVEPDLMGRGPVPASRMALERAGLQAEDIDCWEINEAFAAVVLYAIQELGIDAERVNVRGGGIAIGHPLAASGGRILGTLARILEERNGRFGCATMCCGGGQGVAIVVERAGE